MKLKYSCVGLTTRKPLMGSRGQKSMDKCCVGWASQGNWSSHLDTVETKKKYHLGLNPKRPPLSHFLAFFNVSGALTAMLSISVAANVEEWKV